MWAFNWVDLIIVLLLALVVAQGIRTGILTQVLSIGGFFIALFAAGWLVPHLLPVSDPTLKSMLNVALVLATASFVSMLGYTYGQRAHWSLRIGKHMHRHKHRKLENILGGLPGLAAGLVLVWLLGVAIVRLPFAGLSNSVNDSFIVQQLTRSLPPVPMVFAGFSKAVDPNSQPAISVAQRPTADFDYLPAEIESAADRASNSVVRITSFGCGGLVSGSGFVIGPNLVATNAHVIAGVKNPIIKFHNQSYKGVPIYFDGDLDYAILLTRNFNAPSLILQNSDIGTGSSVAIIGYPGGNYTVSPGIIRDYLSVQSHNILSQYLVTRDAYGIQAATAKGSSGSPVVLVNGQVAGMVFSKSADISNYAYALTSNQLEAGLKRALASQIRVSTGACTVE